MVAALTGLFKSYEKEGRPFFGVRWGNTALDSSPYGQNHRRHQYWQSDRKNPAATETLFLKAWQHGVLKICHLLQDSAIQVVIGLFGQGRVRLSQVGRFFGVLRQVVKLVPPRIQKVPHQFPFRSAYHTHVGSHVVVNAVFRIQVVVPVPWLSAKDGL